MGLSRAQPLRVHRTQCGMRPCRSVPVSFDVLVRAQLEDLQRGNTPMSITASSLSTRRAQSLSTRTATSVPAQPRGFSWGRYALRGLGTVVAAVLANTLFYYLGGALVAYDPDFVVLSNPSGAIIFTVVPAIVAVLLYAGLVRFTRHPAAHLHRHLGDRLRGHPDPRFHLHPDRARRIKRTDRHPGPDARHRRRRDRPPAHQHARSPGALTVTSLVARKNHLCVVGAPRSVRSNLPRVLSARASGTQASDSTRTT